MSDLTADRFRAALDARFSRAKRQGHASLDVQAGDLHREVGAYPGPDHRMPTCCKTMREAMKSADRILVEPPKGNGASLVIRYRLS